MSNNEKPIYSNVPRGTHAHAVTYWFSGNGDPVYRTACGDSLQIPNYMLFKETQPRCEKCKVILVTAWKDY